MNKEEIAKINKHIGELVYEKKQLKKAYNYYHCKRDAEQFKHIEDNYGIGVPTSVGFTPLAKKHIDVLVGEYLELDPDMQITCKDEDTISNMMRDKKLKIDHELYMFLKKYLENSIINILLESKTPTNDPFIEKEMQKIKEDIENTFVSDYEIAAQNIISYIKNSRDIDLKNKMKELYIDLLITGLCYYRVRPSCINDNLSLEILNPLDTFIERNRNEFYLNKSSRAVVRRYLTKEQVLAEFCEELTDEAIRQLDENDTTRDSDNVSYVHVPTSNGLFDRPNSFGILGGLEVTPFRDGDSHVDNNMTITVYEVEWLEWDRKKNKLVRHEGVKIGEKIYITRGAVKSVRSASNPKQCTLSVNGMFFSDRNGDPFSLVLKTQNLQDKLDLLIYYRDNLIATSGTVGDWIDLAHVPHVLGVELPERIEKWFAYKKNGIALFDSSQDGANIINTTFNGFDDTVKADAIQAIQLAIDSIEQQMASTTGVFPEKLGGIQERDAVSNVKVGLRYSTLLTKQYFTAMDLMLKEVYYDLLNLAKQVYPNGMSGNIVLGPKLVKVFTALPEHYTLTDFDIHLQDSTETFQSRETVKGLAAEMIKGGIADAEMILDIITAKNITELKRNVSASIRSKNAENNMIQQLQQQVEQMTQQSKQYEQQIQQLTTQNQQLSKQIETNNQIKWELEKRRVNVEEQEARDKKDFNDKQIEIKTKQLQVEYAQIYDGNPYNDKIRD